MRDRRKEKVDEKTAIDSFLECQVFVHNGETERMCARSANSRLAKTDDYRLKTLPWK